MSYAELAQPWAQYITKRGCRNVETHWVAAESILWIATHGPDVDQSGQVDIILPLTARNCSRITSSLGLCSIYYATLYTKIRSQQYIEGRIHVLMILFEFTVGLPIDRLL